MSKRFILPIRPGNLMWLPIVLTAWVAASHWGTPHLLVAYRWTGSEQFRFYRDCEYWGVSRFRLSPIDGRCPVVIFARAGVMQ